MIRVKGLTQNAIKYAFKQFDNPQSGLEGLLYAEQASAPHEACGSAVCVCIWVLIISSRICQL